MIYSVKPSKLQMNKGKRNEYRLLKTTRRREKNYRY
jgi:hypothetical protein